MTKKEVILGGTLGVKFGTFASDSNCTDFIGKLY